MTSAPAPSTRRTSCGASISRDALIRSKCRALEPKSGPSGGLPRSHHDDRLSFVMVSGSAHRLKAGAEYWFAGLQRDFLVRLTGAAHCYCGCLEHFPPKRTPVRRRKRDQPRHVRMLPFNGTEACLVRPDPFCEHDQIFRQDPNGAVARIIDIGNKKECDRHHDGRDDQQHVARAVLSVSEQHVAWRPP